MTTIASLFWALVFIVVVLLLAAIAAIIGLASVPIVAAALCVIATVTATAITVQACLGVARFFGWLRRKAETSDVMMSVHGDVPHSGRVKA